MLMEEERRDKEEDRQRKQPALPSRKGKAGMRQGMACPVCSPNKIKMEMMDE